MKKIVVGICIIVFLMVIAMGCCYKLGGIPFVAVRDYYDKWHSCNETEGVFVSAQGLCSEVCPNRVRIETGFCILSCPVNKILMDSKGSCHSCDETGSVDVGEDGKCSEICPNRVKTSRGYCSLPCPADRPLMDDEGKCYSCDEIRDVDVGALPCETICPNRMIERHLVTYVNISKGSKEVQETYCVLRQKEK